MGKGLNMKTHSDAADTKFLEGYNCAQSVLFSFHEDFGLDMDCALKLACGFGGCMGRMGEICGAVSGGILVLGLKYGRGKSNQRAQTDVTYAEVREFMKRFSAKHGSCYCRELLSGCNLATPEGQAYFKDNECLNLPACVRDAAAIVEDLLAGR